MQALGFGPVKHFVWRLEFQVRGAPHVHALIWLANRIPLCQLEKIMFATKPSSQDSSKLFQLVTGLMVHSCSLQRCKRGDPNARCRYGFLKAPCRDIHVSEEITTNPDYHKVLAKALVKGFWQNVTVSSPSWVSSPYVYRRLLAIFISPSPSSCPPVRPTCLSS